MNTILQKRIEEAAEQYSVSWRKNPDGSESRELFPVAAERSFKAGATFALQNQWVSVEEALPNYEEDVLVTNDVGDYWFSHRTENENVMRDENNFASVNGIFKITHWMPILQIGGEKK